MQPSDRAILSYQPAPRPASWRERAPWGIGSMVLALSIAVGATANVLLDLPFSARQFIVRYAEVIALLGLVCGLAGMSTRSQRSRGMLGFGLSMLMLIILPLLTRNR